MIHVLVEDGSSGYRWCKYVLQEVIYRNHKECLDVKSFYGIGNLRNELENYDYIINNDILVVLYDDIMENPIVSEAFDVVEEFIYEDAKNLKLEENLFMVSTLGFELTILGLPGLEYLGDYVYYKNMMFEIRKMINDGNNSAKITSYTKGNQKYNELYIKAVEDRSKKNFSKYKGLTKEQLYDYCTIESISKYMMSKVFEHGNSIDAPILARKTPNETKNCWKDSCCYKTGDKCKSPFVDINAICAKDKDYLIKYMVTNSEYKYLIKIIDKLLNIHRDIKSIDIGNVLDVNIIEALRLYSMTGGKYAGDSYIQE